MTPTAARVLAWVVEHTGPLQPLGLRWCAWHGGLCPREAFTRNRQTDDGLDFSCRRAHQEQYQRRYGQKGDARCP